MKIAILGTKGIPNNYGGFEQFAEYLSLRLIQRGHEVTVYNPLFHPYLESEYHGVKIIKKFSPENIIGSAANFIYDHLCLKDALSRDFDLVYECGYHSVALSYKLLGVSGKRKPIIITNMDGLEWKRSKWNKIVRNLIKKLEYIAVKRSPYLISDNVGIQQYLRDTYAVESFFIPYGADPVENLEPAHLLHYNVEAEKYFILIARLEPENNIETILRGYSISATKFPLLVIGNHSKQYGKYLKSKFQDNKIRFLGAVYKKSHLDSLRFFSTAYFHGHSVGGTNPSLLEAMASQSFIIAHKNLFNESVLNDSALFFSEEGDVVNLTNNIIPLREKHASNFLNQNLVKIETIYNWDKIVTKHEELFYDLLKSRN